MKIRKHGEYLYQLTQMFFFNCYLVDEGEGLTLVDSLMANNDRHILEAAEQIGKPITKITLTHAHVDHAGSLDEVRALLPDAEVAFSRRTAAFLRGELDLLPNEPRLPLKGGFVKRDSQPAFLLAPGDSFGSLKVVAAPGHTPDQIAFLDTRDRTLIAGDAFQTQGGIAVSGIVRWLFPFPAFATWHLPTALQTAHELQALNPSRLSVGHGGVIENPDNAIQKAIEAAEIKIHGQTQTA